MVVIEEIISQTDTTETGKMDGDGAAKDTGAACDKTILIPSMTSRPAKIGAGKNKEDEVKDQDEE